MANRLPSAQDLGVVQVQPSLGIAQSRGDTGLEGAAAQGVKQAAGEFGEVSAYLLKAQDEQDRMAAEDALNKYRADLLKRQYDEKEGWQGQLGEAATNPENIKRHLEYLQKSRDQIGATLNTRAKRYFTPQAEASRMHSEAAFYGHVSTQRLQQEVRIFESGQQLLADQVSRSPLGPAGDDLMNASIAEARAKAEAFALRRGFSKEEAVNLGNEAITRLVATRVEGALNADRPDEAKRIYEENEKLLGAKGRQMAGKVNNAYLDWKTAKLADSKVDEIIAKVERENMDKGIPPGGAEMPVEPGSPALRGVRSGGESTAGPGVVRSGGTSTSGPGVTRGLRNNNPGNIVKSGIAWEGKVNGADPRFETFDSPEAGVRALASNLLAYQRQGIDTIEKVINRWAPPSENDTGAYVRRVASEVGMDPKAKINLSDQATLAKVTQAIIRHENGSQPYDAAMINAAVGSAINGGGRTFTNSAVTFQTARTKELQGQLKTLDAEVTAAFKKEFGENNPQGLEKALQRARSRMSQAISADNGIQQQNLNDITTAIINNNVDNFRDLQQIPGMADKLSTAGPYIQHITSLMNMIGHEKSGAKVKGDAETYFALTARVIRGEIQSDKDLLPYLMNPTVPGSKGISIEQLHNLQSQISRVQKPETRNQERDLHLAARGASRLMYLVASRDGVIVDESIKNEAYAAYGNALQKWEMDARDELRKADPARANQLLDHRHPDYIGSEARLMRAWKEEREQLQPAAGRRVAPTAEERKSIPVVSESNWRNSTTYIKLPSAVMTPEGWKGGWFTWKGKQYQKYPPEASVGASGG